MLTVISVTGLLSVLAVLEHCAAQQAEIPELVAAAVDESFLLSIPDSPPVPYEDYCPSGGQPLVEWPTGDLNSCDLGAGSITCPESYTCHEDEDGLYRICCPSEAESNNLSIVGLDTAEELCSGKQQPLRLPASGELMRCQPSKLNVCPGNHACSDSGVCCPPVPQQSAHSSGGPLRCPGDEPPLTNTTGGTRSCGSQDVSTGQQCPWSYYCYRPSTKAGVCCRATEGNQAQLLSKPPNQPLALSACLTGRPLVSPTNGQFQLCNTSISECPARYYCAATSSLPTAQIGVCCPVMLEFPSPFPPFKQHRQRRQTRTRVQFCPFERRPLTLQPTSSKILVCGRPGRPFRVGSISVPLVSCPRTHFCRVFDSRNRAGVCCPYANPPPTLTPPTGVSLPVRTGPTLSQQAKFCQRGENPLIDRRTKHATFCGRLFRTQCPTFYYCRPGSQSGPNRLGACCSISKITVTSVALAKTSPSRQPLLNQPDSDDVSAAFDQDTEEKLNSVLKPSANFGSRDRSTSQAGNLIHGPLPSWNWQSATITPEMLRAYLSGVASAQSQTSTGGGTRQDQIARDLIGQGISSGYGGAAAFTPNQAYGGMFQPPSYGSFSPTQSPPYGSGAALQPPSYGSFSPTQSPPYGSGAALQPPSSYSTVDPSFAAPGNTYGTGSFFPPSSPSSYAIGGPSFTQPSSGVYGSGAALQPPSSLYSIGSPSFSQPGGLYGGGASAFFPPSAPSAYSTGGSSFTQPSGSYGGAAAFLPPSTYSSSTGQAFTQPSGTYGATSFAQGGGYDTGTAFSPSTTGYGSTGFAPATSSSYNGISSFSPGASSSYGSGTAFSRFPYVPNTDNSMASWYTYYPWYIANAPSAPSYGYGLPSAAPSVSSYGYSNLGSFSPASSSSYGSLLAPSGNTYGVGLSPGSSSYGQASFTGGYGTGTGFSPGMPSFSQPSYGAALQPPISAYGGPSFGAQSPATGYAPASSTLSPSQFSPSAGYATPYQALWPSAQPARPYASKSKSPTSGGDGKQAKKDANSTAEVNVEKLSYGKQIEKFQSNYTVVSTP